MNRHIVALEDVASIPCIVILGEPGMGKSTALEDEEKRLKRINNPNMLPPILKRMEEFSDRQRRWFMAPYHKRIRGIDRPRRVRRLVTPAPALRARRTAKSGQGPTPRWLQRSIHGRPLRMDTSRKNNRTKPPAKLTNQRPFIRKQGAGILCFSYCNRNNLSD